MYNSAQPARELAADLVDKKLWVGAATAGWHIYRTSGDGHYRYLSPYAAPTRLPLQSTSTIRGGWDGRDGRDGRTNWTDRMDGRTARNQDKDVRTTLIRRDWTDKEQDNAPVAAVHSIT